MEFKNIILLIIALIVIIHVFPIYSCCRCKHMGMMGMGMGMGMGRGMMGMSEGFTSMTELSDYNIQKKPVNTSSWFAPSLVYNKKHPTNKGIQEIMNRPEQPIPLPKDELLIFANTPFKPECCPGTYSNSTGCACITIPQYSYLINRGGNNVPYSEY
jgi:membrane protease subunit (stomatin/prohibitin family)